MTDLSHDLRISREALAAAERRADEAERAALRVRDALCVALGAMQANIAYARRKDEQALAHGIRTAQAALASPIGSGWLPPEQGAEAVRATIERCARVAEADLGAGPDRVAAALRWDGGVSENTAVRIAEAIRALAAHPTEEA